MKKTKDIKKDIPDIKPGDTVKVYLKIKEPGKKGEIKERIQVFEGVVLARKHGKEIGSTITVRKVISGVGVERIFPLHMPTIEKIEIVKRSKTRRAKLYYLRGAKGKRARLKKKDFIEEGVETKEAEGIDKNEDSPAGEVEIKETETQKEEGENPPATNEETKTPEKEISNPESKEENTEEKEEQQQKQGNETQKKTGD